MAAPLLSTVEPSLIAFLLAFTIDVAWGEPPNAVHPVAWMGNVTSLLLRVAPGRGPALQLAFGALLALLVPASFALASAGLLIVVRHLQPLELVVTTLLLKPTFAVRALGGAAVKVRDSLAADQLSQARRDLGGLCSRDASTLDEPLLVAGTVESLAENTSDSVVAPFFYYALLGLPGVVFYRAVNTLDAMIGYRGRYEWLGKAAARLDDFLNLIPARLTAALLLCAGALTGRSARRGWLVLWRDGSKTASPNAGHPMAAMAGLLGVELEKRGEYRLGDPVVAVETSAIDAAWRVVLLCATLAATLTVLSIGARHVRW